MLLSAARRLLFCFIKKVVKKIKFAAMHINERLNQVGLKLAFARKRSDSKPTVKNDAFICLTATMLTSLRKLKCADTINEP